MYMCIYIASELDSRLIRRDSYHIATKNNSGSSNLIIFERYHFKSLINTNPI